MKLPEKLAATFIKYTPDHPISIMEQLKPYIDDGQVEIVAEDNLMVTARVDSEFATFLKLKDSALANRMHVSHICGDLKDKFRTRP